MERIITRTKPTATQVPRLERVAAYARVSTDKDAMIHSLSEQVSHYSQLIQRQPGWAYAGVYVDEALTGTKDSREGFQRLLADCRAGQVDKIITKSVSRFARNTVDSLVTVRQLKEKGVEVFFEKDNIFTLDSKGELLITIMSSLAQEESRSISENVTWGQRKRFADGKVSLPYKQFLGYEKGEDDLPKIVEEEAAIVRMIYALYLEGCTAYGITQRLEKQGIPSPAGKARWSTRTVESILQNEKYKGDAILQKSYTVDFLTKRKKANEGELPQYYIEHSHPAIVTKEVFELAQLELRQRKATGHASTASCFSAKVVCGCCGGFFGSKLWHSTDKYRRTIWQCNNKFKGGAKCTTPHVTQQQLEEAFVREVNGLVSGKAVILDTLEGMLQGLTDTSGLDKSIAKLEGERAALLSTLQEAVDTNAHATQNQEEYQQRYAALVTEHDRLKQRIDKLADERGERHGRRLRLAQFVDTLRAQGLVESFDERLFRGTVERVTVGKDGEMAFVWRCDHDENQHTARTHPLFEVSSVGQQKD